MVSTDFVSPLTYVLSKFHCTYIRMYTCMLPQRFLHHCVGFSLKEGRDVGGKGVVCMNLTLNEVVSGVNSVCNKVVSSVVSPPVVGTYLLLLR